jgi:hypothetical protein
MITVILDASGSVFLNGNETNISGTTFMGLTLNSPLRWAISGGAFKGYIGEVVAYPSILLVSARQRVEGYLAWKWGLQGSLANGHPYKDSPPT